VKQSTVLFALIAGVSPGSGVNSGVDRYVLLRVYKTLSLRATKIVPGLCPFVASLLGVRFGLCVALISARSATPLE